MVTRSLLVLSPAKILIEGVMGVQGALFALLFLSHNIALICLAQPVSSW